MHKTANSHESCTIEDLSGRSGDEKSQDLTQICYIRSPSNPCCMLLLEIREESVCLWLSISELEQNHSALQKISTKCIYWGDVPLESI